jgi:fibronectin type III domain protein
VKASLLGLLVLLPVAAAVPQAVPAGVQVEAGNQVLRITWQAVPDADASGYYVYVYASGVLVPSSTNANWTLDAPTTEAVYRGAVNGRAYAVAVAAHDAAGQAGPMSPPVAATPRLAQDPTYLAVGLVVVWAGLWGYVLLLARLERGLQDRVARLEAARRRHGDRP